jgi:mannosidase alpha-like ER degradation enhancer 2
LLSRAIVIAPGDYSIRPSRCGLCITSNPKELDYDSMTVVSAGYPLRPEIAESTYYLAQTDPRVSGVGEQMWRDFVKYCRTDEGYAALKSVVTKEKSDSMQSFLFAETFKYFYLLFAPPRTLDFDKVIFNTEAHPGAKKMIRVQTDVWT